MPERRAVPRVTKEPRMKARLKASLPAQIVDISSRGLQLEVTKPLPPGIACDIRIQLDDGEVTLRAMVLRCHASAFGLDDDDRQVMLYRAGLEFEEIAPEVLGRLSASIFFESSSQGTPDEANSTGVATASRAEARGASPSRAPRPDGPVKVEIDNLRSRKIPNPGRA